MSELSEKLEQRRPSVGGRAQATRRQLLGRWGSREDGRDRIVIDTIGGREWRRISPGVDGLFEQTEGM